MWCWLLISSYPAEMAAIEARHCPGRRARWAKIQKENEGVYHSIRCENPDCRRPFWNCLHVRENEEMVERSKNWTTYYGYSLHCNKSVEKVACNEGWRMDQKDDL